MKRSALLPIVSFVLVLGSPLRTAHAQETSRAQALFDDGRRLMNEGHYPEACPKLAASQKLDPGAGTLMNLATCYEKNNQIASAWATFKEAAAASRASSHSDWETAARGRADKLEPELARLAVTVAKEAQVPGLVVERDGQALDPAEWATPIPIDSGLHTIRAAAPGKKTWSTQVTIGGPRSRASVVVPLLENEQPAATVPDRTPGDRSPEQTRPSDEKEAGKTQRLVGLVLGGAGLVSLGAGAFFGLKAGSTYDDALAKCNPAHQCQQSGLDLADDARSQATISTVAFVAGGLLLAGGGVLYFTAPRGTTHVAVGGPGLAGMTVGGAF
jgi:hypothetical protein